MHISTRLILGGSQENTVLSCEGQVEDGHTVALVFGPIYGPEGSLHDRAQAFRASGTNNNNSSNTIELIQTPNLVRQLAPFKDVRCLRDLRTIIRNWKPDVVHTHSSKAGILGRFAAWAEHVPCVVHTIHGLPFNPYISRWRNALYIVAERRAARRCHRIVCVADAMTEQALARGIGKREQYRTVYSGMEVEQFLHPRWERESVRQELGFSESDYVVGTVARLAELKGHDDLLDALGPVMQNDPHLKLLWVGDGWWRDRLVKRIESLGLRDQITLVGLIPPQEIPKYLQAMDLLCHPSYREGLPRTVPQALLTGTPVVAHDVDGTSEACIDDETGKLVEPGDTDGLRGAVLWMREHRQQAQQLAEAGRALCSQRFAARTMVDQLDTVYREVLAQSAGRTSQHAADFVDTR